MKTDPVSCGIPSGERASLSVLAAFVDHAEFVAWLAKHQSSVIGQCRVPGRCAVANFMNWRFPGGEWAVNHGGAFDISGERCAPHPLWLGRFVRAFDALGFFGTQVTGREALAVLAKIGEASQMTPVERLNEPRNKSSQEQPR